MKVNTLLDVVSGVGWLSRMSRRKVTAYTLVPFTGKSAVTNRKYLRHAAERGLLKERVVAHRPGVDKRVYTVSDNGRRFLLDNRRMLL